MTSPSDALLSALPAALRALGYRDIPPYRSLREMAIDGRFPAHQVNGRWRWFRIHINAIARDLGLQRERAPASNGVDDHPHAAV